jgi:DNA-binding CsgD family transcriptional regulator
MFASSFRFEVSDGMDRIDSRTWRSILVATLARGGEGVVVCDGELDVLFSTPRAASLLERLGGLRARRLPAAVLEIVEPHLATGGAQLSTRIAAESGGALHVDVGTIRGAPPVRAVVWIREATLRDHPSLYAALNERYGVTRRSFQLTQLVRQGLSNRDIARELRLTEATVKGYLHDLYRACGVSSRTALIALIDQLRQQVG